MLVRSGELSSTMSRYLIERLTQKPADELHLNTEIVALEGIGRLERVAWQNKTTGEISTHSIPHLFVMNRSFASNRVAAGLS